MSIFIFISDTLFISLCDMVDMILNDPTIPKKGNLWYNTHSNHDFDFPSGPNDPKRMYGNYSVYVYTFGQKAEGQVKVDTLFVYYLSVSISLAQLEAFSILD